MNKGPTNFVEANALLALLEDDVVEARRLIDTLLPVERRDLLVAAVALADLCFKGRHEKPTTDQR